MNIVVSTPTLSILSKNLGTKSACFPVNRIYCIGGNYKEHAIEIGHADGDPPCIFHKPSDAIVDTTIQATIPYPPMTNDVHHEAELVVAIGKQGLGIKQKDAMAQISTEEIYNLKLRNRVGHGQSQKDLIILLHVVQLFQRTT